jgi:hypothetical protein
LYALLKETVDFSNQNFRMGISKSFFDKTHLTKSEIEALGMILKFRNRLAHESNEIGEQITHSELKKLASYILIFANDVGLKHSCENILESSNLSDLIFSIPAVARHMPENIKNSQQLKAISRHYLGLKSSVEGSQASAAELLEALRAAMHGWRSASKQWELLLIKHRILQLQILNKLHIDANKFIAETEEGVFKYLSFKDVYCKLNSYDDIKTFTESIDGKENNLLKLIQDDVQELSPQESVEETCSCEFCKIAPHGLGPLYQIDADTESFLEENVFTRESGVRFVKLLPDAEEN